MIGASIRPYAQAVARFLEPSTASERAERAAHAFALLLVASVATAKYVSGVTPDRVPFTLYAIAVAAAAAHGGLGPGIVATLASLLVAGIGTTAAPTGEARLWFAVEGLAVAAIVARVTARRRELEARLDAAEASIDDLNRRDRRARTIGAAFRHLERVADETAVVVLNDNGIVTEWPGNAERLYGYSADQAVGLSAESLLFERLSRMQFIDLLQQVRETGSFRQPDTHRRRDGTRLHVDVELCAFRDLDAHGFTLTVHNVARRREWEAYREAAVRAQAALQQAADDARHQLAALESLIDPALNPVGGAAAVAELLERLRSILDADGVALVSTSRVAGHVIAAAGLQPVGGLRPVRADLQSVTPGRVTLIHNDPKRVEQTSTLRWSPDVSSLISVPVVYNGQVWSMLELVNERPRRAGDWDVALMRITADRLAAAVVQEHALASKVS